MIVNFYLNYEFFPPKIIFSSLFNHSSRLQNTGRGNLHDLHLPNTYISCITFNSTENPFIIAQLIPYHPRKGALVKGLHVIFLISCFLLHKHSLFVPRLLEVLFLQSPGEITIEIPSSHTLVYVLFWYLFVIHQKIFWSYSSDMPGRIGMMRFFCL